VFYIGSAVYAFNIDTATTSIPKRLGRCKCKKKTQKKRECTILFTIEHGKHIKYEKKVVLLFIKKI